MGTIAGGKAAAKTMKERYGKNYYSNIGAVGGKTQIKTKGFGTHRELARILGAKGGRISRRGAAQQ